MQSALQYLRTLKSLDSLLPHSFHAVIIFLRATGQCVLCQDIQTRNNHSVFKQVNGILVYTENSETFLLMALRIFATVDFAISLLKGMEALKLINTLESYFSLLDWAIAWQCRLSCQSSETGQNVHPIANSFQSD